MTLADTSKFQKQFLEEQKLLKDFIISRYKANDPLNHVVLYCVFSRAASLMQHFMEKDGIKQESIENVNMALYEWEQESRKTVGGKIRK